jgi:predicted O-linked N-acetylglucosamine transferase (SPINDLY family)
MDALEKLKHARNLSDAGRYDDAIALFKELIGAGKELDNAHLGVGVALLRAGRNQAAGDYLKGCGSTAAEIFINAATAYSLVGDDEAEIEALLGVLKSRQRVHENPYRRLTQLAVEKKQWNVAYEALMLLFEINSEDFAVCNQLAQACKELKRHKQAVTFYLKAYELTEDPTHKANLHAALAGLYKDTAEQKKAYSHFREAYERHPNPNTCSNFIMTAQYTAGVNLSDFYNLCREYSARFLRHTPHYQFPLERLDSTKAERGLRIGFMSGDFIAHSLANLLLEPFKAFRKVAPQHDIICYANRETDKEDRISDAYKTTGRWVNLFGKTDKEAAEIIYRDEVDVLIDLAGHTAYNRLPVFGYKPAPVQAGWVSGMMTPAALATINYFITDPWMKPVSADQVCAEKFYEMPAAYTYFPLAMPPPIAPLPADTVGYVTFGSFNNPCKIHDATLEAWARCLREVPRSRFIIKVYTSATEHQIRTYMAARGIGPDRLTFSQGVPSTEDVMKTYTEKIDIVMDTWPCTGCLTSAEAMWMGCPVVTLTGDAFLFRQTWTILKQIGMPELGADTVDGYVKAAVELAKDRKRLRDFRATIRDKMNAAPIRNPELIATHVLKACETFWVDWCRSRAPLKALQAHR